MKRRHLQTAPDWKRVAASRLKKIKALIRSRNYFRHTLEQQIYKGLVIQFHDHCISHPKGLEAGERVFRDIAKFIAESIVIDFK